MAIDRTFRPSEEYDNTKVDVTGEVKGIERILKMKTDELTSDLVALKIAESPETIHTVTYPLVTRNNFELIPYQQALIGERVGYLKTNTEEGRRYSDVKTSTWELEMLTGRLKGTIYTETRWYDNK